MSKLLICALVLTVMFGRGPSTAAAAGTDAIVPIAPASIAQQYELAWQDSFDGTTLNTDNWDYLLGGRGIGYSQPQNVNLYGGAMHIALKKEPFGRFAYTSGGIISRKQYLYGFYEARIRIPRGLGWHTSFWLMSTGLKQEEVDILENESTYNTHAVSGVHDWTNAGLRHGWGYYNSSSDMANQYHIFGLEFTPTTLKYFFDGIEIKEMSALQFPHGPLNIRLESVQLGIGLSDDQPASADFGYVRVFRKTPAL